MVGRPSRRSRSGRETFLEVRKWSGDATRGPEMIGNPTGRPEVVRRPTQRSESGREIPQRSGPGRETFPVVRDWAGDPPGAPGQVWKNSQRSGTGRETLPKVPD